LSPPRITNVSASSGNGRCSALASSHGRAFKHRNGGYGWLEIECRRCKTRASMPLDAIRRALDTPIWKLEPSFRCRSCGTRRFKPPVRMIKLTEQREITPYKWVHPDEER
jgi:DNA-directed RNA polymerase subunit RPC12/RpoP